MLLSKFKFFALAALGIYVLGQLAALTYSTWKLDQSIKHFDEATKDIIVGGSTENAIAKLETRITHNETITFSSLGRLDQLQEEVLNKSEPSLALVPPPVTTIREVRIETRQQKETSHAIPKAPDVVPPSNVALRAVNELWVDFCQRFPDESDCRERQAQGTQL